MSVIFAWLGLGVILATLVFVSIYDPYEDKKDRK
jgi:hypothetical protein